MVGIGGRMRSLHAYWHKNSDLDESGVPGDWVEICCGNGESIYSIGKSSIRK